jgi:diguanylate cyclase (GGDEF)-like protein/PAS domain S-box-containing protein
MSQSSGRSAAGDRDPGPDGATVADAEIGGDRAHQVFLVDVTSPPATTAAGGATSATVRDITFMRLAAFAAASGDAVVATLVDGTITSWNAGAEQLYGYTADQMLGANLRRLVPPDLLGDLPEILRWLAQGEQIEPVMARRLCRDGRVIDVAIAVSPICDPHGILLGATTVSRAVAEHERTSDAASRLGAALGPSDRVVISWTGSGRVTGWNGGAMRLFGLGPPATIGPDGSRPAVDAGLGLDPAGPVSAADRAEASEIKYRLLLDRLPDTVTAVYDREHRIITTSGWAATFVGVSFPDGVAGRTVDEIFGPEDAVRMHGYLDAAFAGHPVEAELHVESSGAVSLVHAISLPAAGGSDRLEVMVVIRDVTVARQRAQALTLSLARWSAVFDRAPIALAELKPDGSILQANQAMAELLEVPIADLTGAVLIDFSHPDERPSADRRQTTLVDGGTVESAVRHIVTGRGGDRWVTAGASVIAQKDGHTERTLAYMVDITSVVVNRQRLSDADARFASLVEHSTDAILVLDGAGPIMYCSPSYFRITGDRPASAVGSSLWRKLHPDDMERVNDIIAGLVATLGEVATFECRLRHRDGRWRNVDVTASNRAGDPAVGGTVVNLHDVTDRVQAAADRVHLAMHDALTGLPNRALLLDRLSVALARASRSGRPCAVLFMDLDRFKQINDTLGHAVGDQVLTTVADRLRRVIRPEDSAARFGGDEFVVVAENIVEAGDALRIAERIRVRVALPIVVRDRTVTVACSVGIAFSDHHEADELLQEADMAVYQAKQSGRNRWVVYDPAMRVRAHRRLGIEDLIRTALDGGLVEAYYQPIIDLTSGLTIGTEALARIKHPDGTLFYPNDFIPVAEDSGLIIPLGVAVLNLACAQQARWQAGASTNAHVAVNVSARQLSSESFVQRVGEALVTHALRPGSLCIELTESTLIDVGSMSADRLRDLKELGVTVALDDFGTGWSSLSYLRRLPIDVVKIDQSFVAGLGTDSDDTELVRAVIDLGHALDLTTIAEGVETETQDRLLRELGCTRAQGYLYGHPEPVG